MIDADFMKQIMLAVCRLILGCMLCNSYFVISTVFVHLSII